MIWVWPRPIPYQQSAPVPSLWCDDKEAPGAISGMANGDGSNKAAGDRLQVEVVWGVGL